MGHPKSPPSLISWTHLLYVPKRKRTNLLCTIYCLFLVNFIYNHPVSICLVATLPSMRRRFYRHSLRNNYYFSDYCFKNLFIFLILVIADKENKKLGLFLILWHNFFLSKKSNLNVEHVGYLQS